MNVKSGQDRLQDYEGVFGALSDKTRLRIAWVLLKADCEMCVCEVMDSLGESQYNVSRHLKVLKNAGIVLEQKRGRWVFYSMRPDVGRFQESVLQAVRSLPDGLFQMDHKRLKRRLALRQNRQCVVGMNAEVWQNIIRNLPAKDAGV
jgi:ArsR family transcriptional regulator